MAGKHNLENLNETFQQVTQTHTFLCTGVRTTNRWSHGMNGLSHILRFILYLASENAKVKPMTLEDGDYGM